jgi:hypothetical protein
MTQVVFLRCARISTSEKMASKGLYECGIFPDVLMDQTSLHPKEVRIILTPTVPDVKIDLPFTPGKGDCSTNIEKTQKGGGAPVGLRASQEVDRRNCRFADSRHQIPVNSVRSAGIKADDGQGRRELFRAQSFPSARGWFAPSSSFSRLLVATVHLFLEQKQTKERRIRESTINNQ